MDKNTNDFIHENVLENVVYTMGAILFRPHSLVITATAHECHGVSNHRLLDCLFNSLFVLGNNKENVITTLLALCEGIPSMTPCVIGGISSQEASNAEL